MYFFVRLVTHFSHLAHDSFRAREKKRDQTILHFTEIPVPRLIAGTATLSHSLVYIPIGIRAEKKKKEESSHIDTEKAESEKEHCARHLNRIFTVMETRESRARDS